MNSIENLIRAFSKLPGLGPRSAQRIVLKLLREPDKLLQPLIESALQVRQDVQKCSQCGNLDMTSPCGICSNSARDHTTICVVEDVADLWAIERGGMYKGSYHVLGGTLSAIEGRTPDALGVPQLLERIPTQHVKEVILATNNTVEGQTTAHYLQEAIETYDIKLSRLAQGIPIGGELDYLDEGTLGAALVARTDL